MGWNVLGKNWERLGTFGKNLGKIWESVIPSRWKFYFAIAKLPVGSSLTPIYWDRQTGNCHLIVAKA